MDFPIVDYLTNPVTEEELLYAGIMFSWSDGNYIVQPSDDQNYTIDNLSNDEGRPIDNGIVEESDEEWISINLLNDEDFQIDNGIDKELAVESNDHMIQNVGNDEGPRPINNGTVEERFNELIANFVNDGDFHIDNGIGEELVEECAEWVKILLDDVDSAMENGIDKKFVEESKDYMIMNLGNDEDSPIEISSDESFVKECNEYVIKNPVTEEELQDAGIKFRWNCDNNTVQQSDGQNHMINNLRNDESRPLDSGIVEESSDDWINNHLNDDDLPIDNGIDKKLVEQRIECIDNSLNDEDLSLDNGIDKELIENIYEWIKNLFNGNHRPIENSIAKKFVEESNDYMSKNLGNDEDRSIEISSDKNLVEESDEYMIKNLVNDGDRPIEYGSDDNLVEERNEFMIKNLRPGFRFRPKDEELIRDFLAKNMPLPPNIIQEDQLYNHHPRDICQNHELIQANEWYFFTLRQKKYSNGARPNRTIGGTNGFWKATGGDVKITTGQHEIGLKKTLVYYEGKAKDRNGGKTNWIMHEYRINDTAASQIAIPSTRSNSNDTMMDYDWVLCRIFHRQTSKPKPKDNEEVSRFSESFDIEK